VVTPTSSYPRIEQIFDHARRLRFQRLKLQIFRKSPPLADTFPSHSTSIPPKSIPPHPPTANPPFPPCKSPEYSRKGITVTLIFFFNSLRDVAFLNDYFHPHCTHGFRQESIIRARPSSQRKCQITGGPKTSFFFSPTDSIPRERENNIAALASGLIKSKFLYAIRFLVSSHYT